MVDAEGRPVKARLFAWPLDAFQPGAPFGAHNYWGVTEPGKFEIPKLGRGRWIVGAESDEARRAAAAGAAVARRLAPDGIGEATVALIAKSDDEERAEGSAPEDEPAPILPTAFPGLVRELQLVVRRGTAVALLPARESEPSRVTLSRADGELLRDSLLSAGDPLRARLVPGDYSATIEYEDGDEKPLTIRFRVETTALEVALP
ncbi:MAG: hypothetical protein EXS13_03830 [Planctomycetes bacterium]|nr:hypothetical protein [Planctomycetota bacterium]